MILIVISISLFLGIIFLKINLVAAIILVVASFLFFLVRLKKRALIIYALFFAIGIGLSQIRIITSYEKTVYRGAVIEAKENYYLLSSSLERIYIYEKENTKEVGDILVVEGVKKPLNFTTIESEFDFANYLNNKGVYSMIDNPLVTVVYSNFIRIKEYQKWFLSYFNDEGKAVVNAYIFGTKSYESEIFISFDKLGIVQLLSISGIYLNILYTIIKKILSVKLNDKVSEIIAIAFLIILSVFSFPRFAVIRVILLLLFKWFNAHLLKRRFTNIEVISILMILTLLIDHNLAYQASFYLGFGASLVMNFIMSKMSKYGLIKRKILIASTLYMFFIPYNVFINNELSLLSPFYQVIVYPFSLVLYLSSVTSVFSFPLFFIINPLSIAFTSLCQVFANTRIMVYSGPFLTLFYFVYYSLYILSLYFFSLGIKKESFIVAGVLLSMTLMYLLPVSNRFRDSVSFINVGQGDSILIEHRGSTILIDTGGNKNKDIAMGSLIPFFKKRRIYRINYLITTHDDFDHAGAKDSLMANFKVDNYISTSDKFPMEINSLVLTNLNDMPTVDDNDSSLVIYLELLNKKWLLMGDASKVVESEVMKDYPDLDVDILKVGHHGSNTSTSETFIQMITPDEAIISVGKNYYGHPHQNVLDILVRNGVIIRRTDKEGTITYSS